MTTQRYLSMLGIQKEFIPAHALFYRLSCPHCSCADLSPSRAHDLCGHGELNGSMESQPFPASLELLPKKTFREDVRDHVPCADVFHRDQAIPDHVSEEMMFYIDVLRPLMLYAVRAQKNGSLVVAPQRHWAF